MLFCCLRWVAMGVLVVRYQWVPNHSFNDLLHCLCGVHQMQADACQKNIGRRTRKDNRHETTAFGMSEKVAYSPFCTVQTHRNSKLCHSKFEKRGFFWKIWRCLWTWNNFISSNWGNWDFEKTCRLGAQNLLAREKKKDHGASQKNGESTQGTKNDWELETWMKMVQKRRYENFRKYTKYHKKQQPKHT